MSWRCYEAQLLNKEVPGGARLRNLLLLACSLVMLFGTAFAFAGAIEMGESFPDVTLPAPDAPAQRAYLGLGDKKTFTLADVQGRVVLVEMINVLCPHCRKQTKPYNELFRMLENDPVTRGQVKMLGVAVANSPAQIADFIEIYEVAYPIVSDRKFGLHKAVRGGPTPFSIYLLRDEPGQAGVVAGTHLGEDRDVSDLCAYLKDLLTMHVADFSSLPGEETAAVKVLLPPQPETEIAARVKAAFATQGKDLQGFRRLRLPSGLWVYTATVTRDGRSQPLFAEVVSRSAICDVCHDVHFFYLFDERGTVLDLKALQLTKYGNKEWTSQELTGFLKHVKGGSLKDSWNFDPQVDAVTSATMTSAIIFDSLDQGRHLLKELRTQGLLRSAH